MLKTLPAKDTGARRRPTGRKLGIILILGLAAALRLWGLGDKSLWLDEIMTVDKATMSFDEMMQQIRQHDAHPPFFQIVEWLWLKLGRGDAFARIPSAAAGMAAVWLSHLIARRLFGRKAGLASAAVMAVSYFDVYYSQEARLYALVAAIFLGQVWLLLRILDLRGRAGLGLWAAYGILGLISLYTYVLCVLTLGSLAALYLWLTWKRHRQWAHFAAVHMMIGVLFLPWAPVLRQRTATVEASIAQLRDAAGRPGLGEISAGVVAWGVGSRARPEPAWAPAAGLALLVLAGLCLTARKARRPTKVLAALFILPLAGYLLLPMPRLQAYEPKHLAFLQPLLMMTLAAACAPAFAGRWPQLSRPLAYVALVVAALNLLSLARYYRPEFQKEDWRGMSADVRGKLEPDDAVIFNPGYVGFALEYYARTPEEKIAIRLKALRGVPAPAQYVRRVWLIECLSPVAAPSPQLRQALVGGGWTDIQGAQYPGDLGRLRWTLFTRGPPPGRGPQP